MMETHWIVAIISGMSFMAEQEFGGTVMMTISLKLLIYQKVFIKRYKKNTKEKKKMARSTDVLFVVYMRTSNLGKQNSNVFK